MNTSFISEMRGLMSKIDVQKYKLVRHYIKINKTDFEVRLLEFVFRERKPLQIETLVLDLFNELNFEEIGVDVFKDANEKILGHHIPEELYGQVKYIPRNLLMKYCGYVFNNLNPILIKRMKLRNKILILAKYFNNSLHNISAVFNNIVEDKSLRADFEIMITSYVKYEEIVDMIYDHFIDRYGKDMVIILKKYPITNRKACNELFNKIYKFRTKLDSIIERHANKLVSVMKKSNVDIKDTRGLNFDIEFHMILGMLLNHSEEFMKNDTYAQNVYESVKVYAVQKFCWNLDGSDGKENEEKDGE